MLFFFVSLVAFGFVIYIVGKVWFSGARNGYLVVFFLLGTAVSAWTLLNGLSGIVAPQHVRVLEPLWMTCVCCIPLLLLLYILYFTGSPLADSRLTVWGLAALAAADAALLLTNPLHMLFYSSFNERGRGVFGPLYWVHSTISYAALTAALILLLVHVAKNWRRQKFLIGFLLGCPWPFVLNLLYVFGPLSGAYDPTPLGFVIMFFTFGVYSVRLRLFNLKDIASTSLLESLTEGIVMVDNVGLVNAVNPAFRGIFPAAIELGVTSIGELADFMRSAVVTYRPDDVFEAAASPTLPIDGGEFAVRDRDGSLRIFALQKDFVIKRGQLAGYILTLVDVSAYRKMQIMEQNNTLLLDIRAASVHMAEISQQISRVSGILAEGSGDQESSIKRFSSSLAQMKSMVEETARTTRQAAAETIEAERKMTENQSYMERLGDAISAINQSARSCNAVIKTIDDIAFQTNILSINASIQSALAGHHGQGFAVVANEVHALSLTTARSAQESSELIENCFKCAQEGAKIMAEANESLVHMRKLAEQSSQTIAKITEATRIQAEEITALSEVILSISQVTSHNAAIAQQYADASREMSAHSAALKGISEKLELGEYSPRASAQQYSYRT